MVVFSLQRPKLLRHLPHFHNEKVFYACLDVTIRRHLLAGKGHDLKTGSKEQSCLRDKREGSPDTSTLNDAEKIKAQGDKRKKKGLPTLLIYTVFENHRKSLIQHSTFTF